MMKKIEIVLDALFDELPLGPKYGAFWKERDNRLKRREEAKQLATEKSVPRPDPPDFIKAIILRRAQLKISQAELARQLRTHQAVISRLETGQGKNQLTFLLRIYDALGLKLKVVIDASNDKKVI